MIATTVPLPIAAEKEKAQQEANARQYEAQAELSRQSAEQKRIDAAEKLKQADVPEHVVAPDSDSGDAAVSQLLTVSISTDRVSFVTWAVVRGGWLIVCLHVMLSSVRGQSQMC